MATQKLHDILGLDDSSTEEQIKAAYRAKVKEVHPDKNKVDTVEEASRKFKELKEAFNAYQNGKNATNNVSTQSKLHTNHADFSFAALAAKIEADTKGKGILSALPPRPQWAQRNVDPMECRALVRVDNALTSQGNELTVTNGGRYGYTRTFDDIGMGNATLDLTGSREAIHLDFSSDANIKAGVELAKEKNWTGIDAPNDLSEAKKDKLKEYCKEYDIKLNFYDPANANQNQQDQKRIAAPKGKELEVTENRRLTM